VKTWRITLAWLVLLVAGAGLLRADTSPEYKLKAAYLFNFTKFVDWPTNAFADAKAVMVIGVLGEDPFGNSLEEIVQNRTINGRSLAIQRVRRVEELKNCQLLFISRSEQSHLKSILAGLDGRPVLTVSDADDFLDNGGTISLVLDGRNIRFEINAGTAERAGLKIDAQLLSLAKTVRPANPRRTD
jgi:hypothetical protein